MWLFFLRYALLLKVSHWAESIGQIGPTKNLTEYLIKVHNPRVTPEGQLHLTYKVQFGQVLRVNEVAQCIGFLLYIEQRWNDPSLSWDPAQFGGLTAVWIPVTDIWLPDIIVTNIADVKYIMEEVRLPVYISYSGNVTFAYPIKYDVTCAINIERFPFDSQACFLSVNTWAYSTDKLNITPVDTGILDLYQTNDEWQMDYKNLEIIMTEYWGLPWKNILYHFTLTRRPLFYIITLFVPSSVITIVAIIGLFAPSSSSGSRTEKVTMGITTMLTMAIFLMMVAEQMPKTSTKIPLIGMYFMFQIGVITLATILTVVIMSIHRLARHKSPPPQCLRYIFIIFPAQVYKFLDSCWETMAGTRQRCQKKYPRFPAEKCRVDARFAEHSFGAKHDDSRRGSLDSIGMDVENMNQQYDNPVSFNQAAVQLEQDLTQLLRHSNRVMRHSHRQQQLACFTPTITTELSSKSRNKTRATSLGQFAQKDNSYSEPTAGRSQRKSSLRQSRSGHVGAQNRSLASRLEDLGKSIQLLVSDLQDFQCKNQVCASGDHYASSEDTGLSADELDESPYSPRKSHAIPSVSFRPMEVISNHAVGHSPLRRVISPIPRMKSPQSKKNTANGSALRDSYGNKDPFVKANYKKRQNHAVPHPREWQHIAAAMDKLFMFLCGGVLSGYYVFMFWSVAW